MMIRIMTGNERYKPREATDDAAVAMLGVQTWLPR